MRDYVSREVRLKARPSGMPTEADFALAEARVQEPGDGQVLVRNIYMSVDPYMRGRMVDKASYTAPFQLGEPLSGSAVGRVVVSRRPDFAAGDFVRHEKGWREYYLSDGSDLSRVDPALAPLRAFLGVLGMTGLTAYVGMLDIGRPAEGETVFVSAAAGAVGSVACQIAKIKGCRVIGSAGSAAKVAWLTDIAGIDDAFDYHEVTTVSAEIGRRCPGGIDVDFENVGGPYLEAALRHLKPFGRIVLCGLISQYNATMIAPGPRNISNVITKRLTVGGLIVTDHLDRLPQFYADMAGWIAGGRMRWTDTVVEGIEHAPRAFLDLFSGGNLGKMIVRVGTDPTA